MRKPLSLYIHIPFCKSKCHYCNFVSSVANPSLIDAYMNELFNEIILRGKEYVGRYEIKSLYIGGGTPSSLDEGKIQQLLHIIYNNFNVLNDAEVTIEINPNTINQNKINEYLRAGINRFSVGLQSASPRLLKLMGRTHTFEDFKKTIQLLSSSGVSNISTDIMLGLPTQTIQDVEDTLEKIIKLNIQHISAYLLSIEDGTAFYSLVNSGELKLPTDSKTLNLYNTAFKILDTNGFNRYEFSNFAKNGFTSKHNKIYWDRKEYIGFGVSAHSYIDGVRFSNTSNINQYITSLADNVIALDTKDTLTKDEMREESIMLGLRLADGLDLNQFEKEFGQSLLYTKNKELTFLIKEKLLIIDQFNRLRATSSGFLVLNKIIEMLI